MKYEDFKKELSTEKGLVEQVSYYKGNKVSIFRYLFQYDGLFSNDIIKEFRGTTFINEKECFLGLSKFFNLDQTQETQFYLIKDKKIKTTTEKVDGSIIMPLIIDGEIIMKSHSSITSIHSQKSTVIVNENEEYKKFILDCYNKRLYPSFEFISPEHKIVVEYEQDELVLLQIRNEFGEYLDVNDFVSPFKVRESYDFKNLKEVVDYVKDLQNFEGFVVEFEDGQMIKVKSDWYLINHEYVFENFREDDILHSILNSEIDDIISSKKDILGEHFINILQTYNTNVIKYINDVLSKCLEIDVSLSDKEAAMLYKNDKHFFVIMAYKRKGIEVAKEHLINDMKKKYYRYEKAFCFLKSLIE